MARLLRLVNDPLGSYLRVGGQDHTFLAQMLVEGKAVASGLIADTAQLKYTRIRWTLRPASDRAVRAAEVEPGLLSTRKRLDSWARHSWGRSDHQPRAQFQPACGRQASPRVRMTPYATHKEAK